MTLVADVRSLSQSTTTITTNAEVAQFLQDGANTVVRIIPGDILSYASTEASVNTALGYSAGTAKVIGVRRGNYECKRIPKSMQYSQAGDLIVTSMFKGSAIKPVYFYKDGKIFIKPDPSISVTAYVDVVKAPSMTSSTTGTKLGELDTAVVMYAASLDCLAMASYWTENTFSLISSSITRSTTVISKIDTNIVRATSALSDAEANRTNADTNRAGFTASTSEYKDAILKSRYLVDASSELSNGNDAEYYLSDEDTELVTANLNIASQEINRARASLEGLGGSNQAVNIMNESVAMAIKAIDTINDALRIEAALEDTLSKTLQLSVANSQMYLERSSNMLQRFYTEIDRFVGSDPQMMALGLVGGSGSDST